MPYKWEFEFVGRFFLFRYTFILKDMSEDVQFLEKYFNLKKLFSSKNLSNIFLLDHSNLCRSLSFFLFYTLHIYIFNFNMWNLMCTCLCVCEHTHIFFTCTPRSRVIARLRMREAAEDQTGKSNWSKTERRVQSLKESHTNAFLWKWCLRSGFEFFTTFNYTFYLSK